MKLSWSFSAVIWNLLQVNIHQYPSIHPSIFCQSSLIEVPAGAAGARPSGHQTSDTTPSCAHPSRGGLKSSITHIWVLLDRGREVHPDWGWGGHANSTPSWKRTQDFLGGCAHHHHDAAYAPNIRENPLKKNPLWELNASPLKLMHNMSLKRSTAFHEGVFAISLSLSLWIPAFSIQAAF